MHSQGQDGGTTVLDRLEGWWHDWRQRARERAELSAADYSLLSEIARDAGAANTQELLAVVNKGPKGSALMKEMAEALGVDLTAAQIAHPHVVRQMEISCSNCDSKRRCSCELEDGTAAQHASEFCNNAEVFDALKR